MKNAQQQLPWAAVKIQYKRLPMGAHQRDLWEVFIF